MTTNEAAKLTFDEHVELLTGFDELAIEKQFGTDFDSLRLSMSLRALVFVEERRGGADDKTAYRTVMGLSLKAITDRFADPEPEVSEEEPVTDEGKDDSPDESTTSTSAPGAA